MDIFTKFKLFDKQKMPNDFTNTLIVNFCTYKTSNAKQIFIPNSLQFPKSRTILENYFN